MKNQTKKEANVNYEAREYDGIKWIRYDDYLDALDRAEKATRERDIEGELPQ